MDLRPSPQKHAARFSSTCVLTALTLLFFALPSYPQAAPAPRSSGKGSIDGIVVDDQSKPVAAAEVLLVPPSQLVSALRSYTTGANGAFHFEGLAPDRYSFRIQHATLKMDLYEIPAVDVRLDQHLSDVRISVFIPSVITGTVT